MDLGVVTGGEAGWQVCLHGREVTVEWSRWRLGAMRPNRVEAEEVMILIRDADGAAGRPR
jgi:hypothetical protein